MNEGIDLSDIPELGDEFFANAKRMEALVQKHTLLVDRDIYEWFKSSFPEPECTRLIGSILRRYMDEQKAKSGLPDGSLG